ncbi:hypothetical protein ACWNT8_09930 [Pigmentibacter ruber]
MSMHRNFEKNELIKCSVFYTKESIIKPEEIISGIIDQLKADNSPIIEFILTFQHTFFAPWKQGDEVIWIYYMVQKDEQRNDYQITAIYPTNVFYTFINSFEEYSKKGKLLQIQKVTITEINEYTIYNRVKENIFLENKQNLFQPDNLYKFIPINIIKPWGQEIWFTGVEKRGVAKIKSIDGELPIPISWLFQACPSTLLGKQVAERQLILVKILDPISEKVYGDLYYELHTEKNEVYVVTQINSPSGKIKFGVNPDKLKAYKSESAFKKELLTAIKEYELIRKKIDSFYDKFRTAENIPLNEPILPDKIKEWRKEIPKEDILEEEEKRKIMDSFAGYLDLEVADVIQVPTLVPHALQSGVTVVEFQTPTYERYILSFAQKVLTQDHWDTEKAIDIMQLVVPKKTNLQIIKNEKNFKEEVVCKFNEFQSSRITLEANKTIKLPTIGTYRILFHLSGNLIININQRNGKEIQHKIVPGECIFIPANLDFNFTSVDEKAILLLCIPS